MGELEKWELINQCETIEALEKAVITVADENGIIWGRKRQFDAEKMSKFVRLVITKEYYPEYLTRSYGIRQQALYLRNIIDRSI